MPDPDDPEFPGRAASWMLDLCPPDYRAHPVFRRHLVVLARVAHVHAEASLSAARAAYAGARRDLAGLVPPDAIEETLAALSREGARLAAQVREAALVEEALQGRRWRQRM